MMAGEVNVTSVVSTASEMISVVNEVSTTIALVWLARKTERIRLGRTREVHLASGNSSVASEARLLCAGGW